MPRVGFVIGGGPITPEISPSLLASIRGRAPALVRRELVRKEEV